MSTSTSAPAALHHLVIRASAGTGKTFQLSNRYLQLLADGVPPEQILATTFTRKAAGEIQDRILLRLAEAAIKEEKLAELAQSVGYGSLTRQQCLALLKQTTRNLHRLRISTLDAFFMAIAGNFSLELGLPSGWTIADEVTDETLRLRAIEATLGQDSTLHLLTLLHLLTKGETRRSVTRVVEDTIGSLYQMFLETPPEAWNRLQRVSGLEESEVSDLLQQLESYPLDGALARGRDKNVADALIDDWDSFIDHGIAAKILQGEETFQCKAIPADLIEIYRRLLIYVRARLLNPVVDHNKGAAMLLDKYHREYERIKTEEGAFGFNDITRIVARWQSLHEGEKLGFRLDGGIRHLLLDEFQDTSLAQWQVLRAFAREITSQSGSTSFFCVGDGKQAIYGWRGGLAQIFDALEAELTNLSHSDLTQSFRSSQPVIDTVNLLFQNLHKHEGVTKYAQAIRSWQERFTEHQTARRELPGYACVRVMPEFPEAEDKETLPDAYVAEYVRQLLADHPGMEIGVLVRKNDKVRRLIFALRALGIEASEEGGNPLVDSAAVTLILSLLQLADHPGDRVARYHLARSVLGQALGFADYRDDAAAARLASDVRGELFNEGFGPSILRWAKLIAPECNRREMSRLDQLVELAYRYQPPSALRADDFVRLVKKQKVTDPSAAPVRVMTIHQSKGLQFDIVVLHQLDILLAGQTPAFAVRRPSPIAPVDTVCRWANENVQTFLPAEFQSMFAATQQQHVVETLCLLYVAVTRPVYALHMLMSSRQATAKKPLQTLGGLVRAAICTPELLKPDSIAYECGDANWYDLLPLPPEKHKPIRPAEKLEIRLKPSTEGRERGWQSISPSQLEGGATIRVVDVLRQSRSAAQDFGTLVHAWFAQVSWLEDELPSDTTLRRIATDEVGWNRGLDDVLKQFRQWLKEPAMKSVLSKSAYRRASLFDSGTLEVHNEYRFAMREEGQLMTGSIDRLVLLRQGDRITSADIVDYKTDAVPDKETLAAKVDFYRPQLEAYRRAVARTFQVPLQDITARLYFLSAGEVRSIH